MDNELRILKAGEYDARAIHKLIAEVLAVYQLYHLRPDNVDDDIDDMSTHYFGNNGYFWIVKKQTPHIIGSAAIFKISGDTCELRKMYLLPEEQGKGIGKLLLNTAIEKARELGYKKMILKTNSKLSGAIEMYKKNGFVFYDISEDDKKADCDVAMHLKFN